MFSDKIVVTQELGADSGSGSPCMQIVLPV
jgi:hypothetical protein